MVISDKIVGAANHRLRPGRCTSLAVLAKEEGLNGIPSMTDPEQGVVGCVGPLPSLSCESSRLEYDGTDDVFLLVL